jgi:D-3-phosphoglycerate dehydrogenase / 2-oxoglutarate reductase
MAKYSILITDGLEENGKAILREMADVQDRAGISPEELLTAVAGCQAIVVRGRTRVTAAVTEAGSSLKVIGRAGVGVDNIDLEAARKRGITVVNAPTSTTGAVAELAFGLLLALAREIPRADAAMKQGRWLKKELEGVELAGKTLGVIGYGRIGKDLGKRAAAFGMNTITYDPFIQEESIRAGGAESVSLQDLLAWSDFISLHLPFDVQTRDLIGPQAISQMKDGVRIICAARGGIIDEAALLAALNSGKIAGAALDVFTTEPPGATPLVMHPKVIATPHIGAQTAEAQARASEDIAIEVLAALQGKPLRWKIA